MAAFYRAACERAAMANFFRADAQAHFLRVNLKNNLLLDAPLVFGHQLC
jgi:hypothetical protein